MICELRQIRADYARKLADNPDDFLLYLDEAEDDDLPEEAQGEAIDLDKAWHGLHYLLTGTAWDGQEPACYLVGGGEQIGDEEEHDVGYGPARLLSPAQVAAFASVAAALTPAEIQKRLNPAEMARLEIYPEIWSRTEQDAQDNYDYLVEYAADLQGFLSRAVELQHAVVIYLV